MTETVFVDTSALLPLLDANDPDRVAVEDALRDLRDTPLVTSSYTLAEAGALVRTRLGVSPFRRLGRVASAAFDVVWVGPELHERAWAAASAGGRRGPSLVDHVGFLVMEDLGVRTALALDRHFGERFATLPRRG